jgi:hypothetical protein
MAEPEIELTEANQITPEQEDAAMAAGFADARGAEVPPEVTDLNTDVAEVFDGGEGAAAASAGAHNGATAQAAAPPSDVEKLRAEMAMLGESVRRNFEQVHGKFGEHNRLIQEVVRGRTAAAGAAGAPARRIGADAFRKLAERYPEIASQMTEGLEQVFAQQAQSHIDPAQLDARVNERVAQLLQPAVQAVQSASDQRISKVELSVMHPDWQKVTGTQDFANWFKTKPAQEQHRLYYTWDAPTVAAMLTEYKTAARRTASASNDRQRRLSAAVSPRGTGSGVPTGISDDDALVLGFKAARAGG